ncbi:MAG: MFS transporter [Burkholderiaceae bacterium]
MSDRALTIYCGLLLGLAAFSIDITLPFFAVIRDSLDATNDSTHAIITLNIIALGVGQLFFGTFSDRFGRRPTIRVGLSLYLLGTLAAIAATSMPMLLAARVLQGLGASAAPVTARAIIRDRFQGRQLAQQMALASGIFSLGPILAPLIGVALVEAGGHWRLIFVAMAVAGLGLLWWLRKIPETLARPQLDAARPRRLLANARRVLGHRQSRYFLLLSGWVMVCIVTIIANMPRVMEQAYGITGAWFAILFAIHGVGIIIGQTINHRLIHRIGAVASAAWAAALMTTTFAIMGLLHLTGLLTGVIMAICMFVFAIGYLIVYSNSASMTMEPQGEIAGFTAAFLGFFGQVLAPSLATVGIVFAGGDPGRFSLVLVTVSAVALLALLIWPWLARQDKASHSVLGSS